MPRKAATTAKLPAAGGAFIFGTDFPAASRTLRRATYDEVQQGRIQFDRLGHADGLRSGGCERLLSLRHDVFPVVPRHGDA